MLRTSPIARSIIVVQFLVLVFVSYEGVKPKAYVLCFVNFGAVLYLFFFSILFFVRCVFKIPQISIATCSYLLHEIFKKLFKWRNIW